MLKKIIAIKNIGKFIDCTAAGDVEFRRLTLFYAENGRGKTTLGDILRSLQTGNGDYVAGRQTLASTSGPRVEIRLDDQTAIFCDGAWNRTVPEISIFDATFIHDNIYAGNYVDHEHKKNLYRVIIGEHGVILARRVDELDARSREAAGNVTARLGELRPLVPDRIAVQAFLDLPEEDDLDNRIRSKQTEIVVLERGNEITAKPLLSRLSLPEVPPDFMELLAKTVEDVSHDAEQRVREHIQSHTHEATEEWLSQGLGYLQDPLCPFCAQPVAGVELVAAYGTYFGDSYRALRDNVLALQAGVAQMTSEVTLLRLQLTIRNNHSLCEFWRQFLEFNEPEINLEAFHHELEEVADAASYSVNAKLQRLLEPMSPIPEFADALAPYEAAKGIVSEYNAAIDAVNAMIAEKKAETQTGDLTTAKQQLATLMAIKVRHEAAGQQACQKYQAAVAAKQELEKEKEAAKAELDAYTEDIFERYETRLNQLLEMFGAGFRIADTRRRYFGGTPSSSYAIVINGVTVELGDTTTPPDRPSFKNTLSAGDKSTLALAFFLAQLEHDARLAQKIVVLDDPFTSQDRSRRTCTQQFICKLCDTARQVLVLSHEPSFLKLVWDSVSAERVKCLQMCRFGQNTTITEWDIEDQTRGDYFSNHAVLTTYYNHGTGELRHVARSIRPVMEGYLRFKLPGHFTENEWLGDFIRKIREADSSSPLNGAKEILEKLEAVNEFAKRYHHNQNPGGFQTEPINDGELQTFVKRTLDLVGGF